MIPLTAGFLGQELIVEEQPSRTYRMDRTEGMTIGFTDGIEAVKQAVFKILNTERYRYIMYSWNYGIETEDLYGQPVTYVCPELERRIAEALLMDSRIISVTNFEHDISARGQVRTAFTVQTIYGEIGAEKEVKI